MLAHLPPELLCHVYQHLPHVSVNQMSLTCRSLHVSALPVLYTTVVLSVRTHIRQLEAGLQKSDGVLKHILQQHTKELVLKCKQSGQHRLLFDIRSLLTHLPHLRSLSLVDFHMVPVSFITPLLSIIPHLDTVSLRYCDLVTDIPCVSGLHLPTSRQPYQTNEQLGELKHQQSPTVTTLEFYWTDFSKAAIASILSLFPSLTKVRLLANHNRHFFANNHALDALQQHCPYITDLEIGLQEVKEQVLVDCIRAYGTQLQRLSIRYQSPLTLFAVTKYASLVQDLTVRFSLETKWYPSASMVQPLPAAPSTPMQRHLPRLPYTTTRPHARQRQHQHYLLQQEFEQEIRKKGALLCVLCQCQRLMRLQVESMRPTESRANLPPVIRNALAIVAQKRISLSGTYSSPTFKNMIQASFSVERQYHYQGKLANLTTRTSVLATRKLASATATTTAIDKYQQQQEEDKQNGNSESMVSVGTGTDNDENATNTGISVSTYAATMNNNSNTNSQQRRRHWKDNLSTRMETVLVLDNEQLEEIRYQALPLV